MDQQSVTEEGRKREIERASHLEEHDVDLVLLDPLLPASC